MADNKKQGSGKMKCVIDDSYYVGQWENDKRNGKGRQVWYVELDKG